MRYRWRGFEGEGKGEGRRDSGTNDLDLIYHIEIIFKRLHGALSGRRPEEVLPD